MLNRRDLLRTFTFGGLALGGITAGTLNGCARPSANDAPAPKPDAPDFTIGFLSDPHINGELDAPTGTAKAVEHMLAQPQAPEAVITGGDLVFDVLETDREAADAQFDLLDTALAPIQVPIHHTIGNHDCYGVYESSGISPDDPMYGKELFRQRLGLESTYRSFDHEGWHFVILDTIGLEERHYIGHVDAEQLAWLADDLAANNKPTVVVGHIPLFTNYVEWNAGTTQGIPAGYAVTNSHEVAKVLLQHNVKLVLAGHLHVVETFKFKGIEFANVGAVSGNWWQGVRDGFEEGYTMLEFRGDEVSWRYVDYGWEAQQQDA